MTLPCDARRSRADENSEKWDTRERGYRKRQKKNAGEKNNCFNCLTRIVCTVCGGTWDEFCWSGSYLHQRKSRKIKLESKERKAPRTSDEGETCDPWRQIMSRPCYAHVVSVLMMTLKDERGRDKRKWQLELSYQDYTHSLCCCCLLWCTSCHNWWELKDERAEVEENSNFARLIDSR